MFKKNKIQFDYESQNNLKNACEKNEDFAKYAKKK